MTPVVRFTPAPARRSTARRNAVSRPVLRGLMSTPILYSLTLPIALLDVWVTAYQWLVCPLLGIVPVRRQQYVVIDRHRLAYLTLVEKLNCVYCGYANGVFAYAREVAAQAEQYWCPIKHHVTPRGLHARYAGFAPYGDERAFRDRAARLRLALRAAGQRPAEAGVHRRG